VLPLGWFSPGHVRQAARQAISDAGEDGKFILSTGNQCPRDTPFENIHAMMEAAESYGRY
jgi:uroporphyrinogen decarboxylase